MASKQSHFDRLELLKYLSTIPAHTILRHLQEDTIMEIASKCLNDINTENNMTSHVEDAQLHPSDESNQSLQGPSGNANQSPDRAKRPLNAFIAFRSFYLRLFPQTQQKAASGFLTTLWNKDPYRHRWALIAKVYSFVRDELGKTKAPLSSFLVTACSAMDMLHPDEYLRALGWAVEDTEHGTKMLVQRDDRRVPKEPTKDCPDSELGLFQEMIALGYRPNENIYALEAVLTQKQHPGPTSTISIAEHTAIKSDKDLEQKDKSEAQPTATQETPNLQPEGPIYTPSLEASTPYSGPSPGSDEPTPPATYTSISTPPMPAASLSPSTSTPQPQMSLAPALPVSNQEQTAAAVADSYYRPYYYHFVAVDSVARSSTSSGVGGMPSNTVQVTTTSSPAVLSFDGLADYQAINIDCPWEVDAVMSQCMPAGTERVFVLDDGPPYDPHQDFHFTF
ncbi:hypothetical protein NQ176_g3842 [Zarea fungicola]|uniref:Uncharacterized protein n=1 Tax=Zarea fungicola TaxID=93591 RepID=A0ACC1NH57_9HYPO|nr:hypothetical protein NQ176_g3842 [Lecanicillium fungicola]